MRPPGRHRLRGFSIVELMVAVTLGLVLLAGLASVFINSKQGYRIQESSGRLQENARFAMDYLAQGIRQADFWGGVSGTNIADPGTLASTTASACASAWFYNFRIPLQGWDGGGSSPLSGCTTTAYIANSDVFVVRYADAIPGATASAYLRTLVGTSAVLSSSNTATPANARDLNGDGALDETDSVFTYPYTARVFFLGRFTSPGGAAVPTLYVRDLNTGMAGQPLVEGIEQMKLQYGLDTNEDDLADRYMAAADVTSASLWGAVVSVRVNLVVRGDALDGFTDTNTYPMGGGYTYTPAAADQRLQRRLFVRDVQVRNRVKS